MKIAHLADIHLSEKIGPIINGQNGRLLDTVHCMDYAADKLMDEKPDIILVAGDLFHKSKLWADEMLKEITIATYWLKKLCIIAPTVLLFGTENHDNMEAFENIDNMNIPDLWVITNPRFLNIQTNSGRIQIAGIPGMNKGQFRTLYPGMDMTDENKAISDALGNVVMGLSEMVNPDIPSVLMAHYTVTGCQMENGESVFLNSDVVLPTAALAASNFDLVCLGHIHRAQSVPNCGRPTYYSGPLNAITFNEEGQDKGFYIHELNADTESRFIKTPSREFLTLKMDDFEVNQFIKEGLSWFYKKDPDGSTYYPPVKYKIIRVIYSCDDETNKQFNKKELEKTLYVAGAFYVSEIRPSKILTTTDKQAMSENDSVKDNLIAWMDKQEISDQQQQEILPLAIPLIQEVAASLPTGKLSGAFEPVSLEVKNYRSYKDESFDFSKVSFATVNGPNGIGKSSFFMDAIADCLYEEPREGELTGWISNNEDARSGAITFTFMMGADKYRVIRTRAKSGKATLALQKWNKDKWEDHSEPKKDDTQKKIVSILGMDSLTFKSCALIMQDQYGLFLEADKSDRMQVLGNILGLSMYDKLHELVKEKLKDDNRNVQKLKDELAVLDERLKDKSEVQQNIQDAKEEKKLILEQINQKEAEIKDLQEKSNRCAVLEEKIKSLTDKVITLTNDIKSKENEVRKLQLETDQAQEVLDKKDVIQEKITEYEDAKTKVTTLRTKVPILTQKRADLKQTKADMENVYGKISANTKAIKNLQEDLKSKNDLEESVKHLPEWEENLKKFEDRKTKFEEASQNENELYQKLTIAVREHREKSDKLVEEISQCDKKAQLIKNSNCPIENPSCNFLKDALEAKNKIPELKKELNELDFSEIEKLQKDYDKAKAVLEQSGYNAEGLENIKNVIKSIQSDKVKLATLNGKDELLKNYLQQKAEFEKNLGELQDKKSKLAPECEKLFNELSELEELEKQLPVLEHWNRGKDELPKAEQTVKTNTERITQLNNEITAADEEIKNVEIDRDKLADEIEKLKGIDGLLWEAQTDLRNWQEDRSNIDVSIGVYKSKLEDMVKYETEKQAKIESMDAFAKIAAVYEILVKAFSIDGIPFQIVRSVVDELSAKSNEILSQMTGSKMSIEFKMDKTLKNKKEVNALEIWINDYQRGNMPYLSRSGGQKVKAALSVAFALADLKANRAGIQLGMMFIDEPPYLDQEGTQAYADALETIHDQYNNMKVIAISHDPTMKARFPQSIDVVDSGDEGSKIIFNE